MGGATPGNLKSASKPQDERLSIRKLKITVDRPTKVFYKGPQCFNVGPLGVLMRVLLAQLRSAFGFKPCNRNICFQLLFFNGVYI